MSTATILNGALRVKYKISFLLGTVQDRFLLIFQTTETSSLLLTLKVLNKFAADNILFLFLILLFFKENKAWHFIPTGNLTAELDSRANDSHEMSNLFSLKNKNKQEGQDGPILRTWVPDKFRVKWPFSSEEQVQNRFSRWQPWQPAWISNWNNFSYWYFGFTNHPYTSYSVSSQLAF